jgi:hypothetical protein
MSYNFLIQATRVLNVNNYDESELELVTNFLIAADEDMLSDYNNTCTILSYDNDLELYLEILSTLLVVYEEREEYEICELIKNKMSEALQIINKKTI